MVFGQIIDLAVSEAGTLAVLDGIGCQIWVVDLEANTWNTLGGCGDGPGEFRGAMTAAFVGDTLVVYDAKRMALVKMTLDGEEIGRFPVVPFEIGAASISDLYVGQGGSILAGLDLLPSNQVRDSLHLLSFDGFGGEVDGRGLVSPSIARTTPRSILRPSTFCVGVTDEAGEVVVAVDTWGPQIAVLRRNGFEPLLSVRIPVGWVQPSEHPDRPGYWGHVVPQPEAACGGRYAIVGYRRQAVVSRGVSEVLSAVMVMIDLEEGAIAVLGGDEPPEPSAVLFMTPGAAAGDRFFFFTNSFFEYPVVREYRVIREAH